MQRTLDMTEGEPNRLLLSFAVPMIASNILQQLYNVADSAVAGQVLGMESFTSVGSAGWLYLLGLNLLIGLTQGFSVLFAQRFGARDERGTRDALVTAAYLLSVVTVLLSIAGVALGRWILNLLNTPANIIDGAVVYLRYLFSGLLVTAAYNLLAAALRAFGDSRTPLMAVMIAAVINVGLDLLFVWGLDMGIPGVAFATLLSQMIACLYCLHVFRRPEIARLVSGGYRPDRQTLRELINLGMPLAVRQGLIALGGLVIQYVINGFGYFFVAGITAAQKYTDFVQQVSEGLNGAVSAFTAQNFGAGKLDRVRRGVRTAALIALACAGVFAIVALLLGAPLLRLFLTEEQGMDDAMRYGLGYLRVTSVSLIILYVAQICRAALEGMGDTITPMLASLVELSVRILGVLVLSLLAGMSSVYLANPVAWLLSGLLLLVAYILRTRAPRLN